MLKTFYVQFEKDTNKITDCISYAYSDYQEIQLETPLPPNILAGCYKLEAGSAIYVQEWDKDQQVDDLALEIAENYLDHEFRISNIELGI